ncbi:MAG TPA: hypothetical protein ACFYD6_11805 [Candidatus Brocadiia bacterium]|nr:hypothetical protein [Planctomycetota bacterium]MDO8094651.1 hypothetical protein [Candidatus Brocadiales bacterium]
MIHYSCDICGKPLHADKDVRYVVKIEVYGVYDEDDFDGDVFEDELDEPEDIDDDPELVSGDEDMDEFEDAEYKTFRFDLCSECHSKYLQNPLFIKGRHKTRFFEN